MSRNTKFTIQVDEDTMVSLDRISRHLRDVGYTRMSRGYLLAAAGEWLCQEYEDNGIAGCRDVLKDQLSSYAKERDLVIAPKKSKLVLRKAKD